MLYYPSERMHYESGFFQYKDEYYPFLKEKIQAKWAGKEKAPQVSQGFFQRIVAPFAPNVTSAHLFKMSGDEQIRTLQKLPVGRMRQLSQELLSLKQQIDEFEELPEEERRNLGRKAQDKVKEKKVQLEAFKEVCEIAILHAPKEKEKELLECYFNILSGHEIVGLTAKVSDVAKAEQLKRTPQKELLNRAERLLSLVSGEVKLPDFEPKELEPTATAELAPLLRELALLLKALESPEHREGEAQKYRTLLQTALAGLTRKYILVNKLQLEAVKKAYQDLLEHPQEELSEKLRELESRLKSIQDSSEQFEPCLALEKERLKRGRTYPLELIFHHSNPEEEFIYTQLTRSWGATLASMWKRTSATLSSESYRLVRTAEKNEADLKSTKSLVQEAKTLLQELQKGSQSSQEVYDHLRLCVSDCESSFPDFNDQCVDLKKNHLDFSGDYYVEMAGKVLMLREELNRHQNPFGETAFKMALVESAEMAHQSIEEYFTEDYRAAVLAEIAECGKHAQRAGTVEEAHEAHANLEYVKKELLGFKDKLEQLQTQWKACELKEVELTLDPQDDMQKLLLDNLKRRNPRNLEEADGKLIYRYPFQWLEQQFSKEQAQIDALIAAVDSAAPKVEAQWVKAREAFYRAEQQDEPHAVQLLKELERIEGKVSEQMTEEESLHALKSLRLILVLTDQKPPEGRLGRARAKAQQLQEALPRLESALPDYIAYKREVLSPEKRRRVRKASDLIASEIGYSETTKGVAMGLWTLYNLINTFYQEYREIQNIKSLLPERGVSTFTSGSVKQQMNSLMDCIVQGGEANNVQDWSEDRYALFAKQLTDAERPILEALRHGRLESMSKKAYQEMIEKSPVEGYTVHLLNNIYRTVFWSVRDHSLFGRSMEHVPPVKAREAFEAMSGAVQESHHKLERMLQKNPEILTMPEESFQGRTLDIAPDAAKGAQARDSFQSAIRELLPGDQALLIALRNRSFISSLEPFPLSQLKALCLSDSTIEVIRDAWGVRNAQAHPIPPTKVPEPVLRLPRVQETASEKAKGEIISARDLKTEHSWRLSPLFYPAAGKATEIAEARLPFWRPLREAMARTSLPRVRDVEHEELIQEQKEAMEHLRNGSSDIEEQKACLDLLKAGGTLREQIDEIGERQAGLKKELKGVSSREDFQKWQEKARLVEGKAADIKQKVMQEVREQRKSFLEDRNQAVDRLQTEYGDLMQEAERDEVRAIRASLLQIENQDEHFDEIIDYKDWLRSVAGIDRQINALQSGLLKSAQETQELVAFLEAGKGELATLSIKALVHLVGDPFGRASGYEGWTLESSIPFLRKMVSTRLRLLKEAYQKNPDPALEKYIERLDRVKVALRGAELSNMSADFNMARTFVWANFADLKPGESILLKGGWKGRKAGHAMVYELIKQEDGKATVRFYNRGAGSQYHRQVLLHRGDEIEQKLLPFYEKVNCTLESFVSEEVLGKLIQVLHKEHPDKNMDWNEEDIYFGPTGALKHLDGEVNHEGYKIDEFVFAHHSGICSLASLQAYVSSVLPGQSQETRLNFELALFALDRYFDPLQLESGQDRVLLKAIVVKFQEDAGHYARNGLINLRELQYVLDKAAGWQKALEAVSLPQALSDVALDESEQFKLKEGKTAYLPRPSKTQQNLPSEIDRPF